MADTRSAWLVDGRPCAPADVLRALCLPDTPHYRVLLDELDGLITVDLTEGGRVRMAARLGVAFLAPNTLWSLVYLHGDDTPTETDTRKGHRRAS